ncbi:ABC-three component system middle component 8 [Oceanibaculum pacificum]|nr:ABC-three component system middle component 8 [Oceanibaculum pacificum]
MQLRTKRLCDYNSLFTYARKAVVGGDVLFLPSLNFLYLMGLVEYHPKTDAFEYVGQNEAI